MKPHGEHQLLEEQVHKSLRACWKEGMAAEVMIRVFDYYVIPFAMFLGARTSQIGILVSLPGLLASALQLFSSKAVHAFGSRLKLIQWSVGIQALMLVPVALLALVRPGFSIALLILLISVFRILGSLMGPAWGSLVSDYLPAEKRGRFFGFRSRVVGISGIVSVAFWGFLLQTMQRISESAAFFTLFAGAALFRILSFHYMTQLIDFPLHKTDYEKLSLFTFIAKLHKSNFTRFISYVASITFATQLCAPYFSVRMLKDLNFNYLSYTAVHLASTVAGIAAFPAWGRHADTYGNAAVLKTTAVFIPLVPLLWILAATPVELVMVEIFSGFVWSGFGLCTTNFIYESCLAHQKVNCLVYFNLINGIATFAGASLGGFLAYRLPPLFGYPLLSLFLVSAVLRFCADFFLAGQFKEIRHKAKRISSSQLFFSVLGIREVAGRNTEPEVFPDMPPELPPSTRERRGKHKNHEKKE